MSDPGSVRRLALSSGKIFYDLDAARVDEGVEDVALCRVEQLYPFPAADIQAILTRYRHVTDILWVQEEPGNMGAWTYIQERLGEHLGKGQRLRYVGRPRAASPAAGSAKVHAAEQRAIVQETLSGKAPAKPGKRRTGSATPTRQS